MNTLTRFGFISSAQALAISHKFTFMQPQMLSPNHVPSAVEIQLYGLKTKAVDHDKPGMFTPHMVFDNNVKPQVNNQCLYC